MEIHQVVAGAGPGDAVTNAALEYRRLLRQICPSDIYAAHRHPDLTGEIRMLRDYGSRLHAREDLLIVHLSIGDASVSRFLDERDERMVVVYHNVTPAEYFEPYDPAFARLLREGRAELGRLVDRVELAMADSRFNADELGALGYDAVRVVPLVVDVDRLRAVRPDPVLLKVLRGLDGPTFLYVGQILPHKRPDLLLEAFHVLVTRLDPTANLVVAGHARNATFARAFKAQLAQLSLPRVRYLGDVTPAELVACYSSATAFVTASEHEGFCVPLLEAMAFDRAIVARDHAAVAGTLGDAGLLLPADSDALLLAEALAEVGGAPELRDDLAARGRRRLEVFDPDLARAAFLDALLEVA
jgi:glycosyltransferase involved in cell wall biosynthesis